jgi:hypothetical protein
MSHSFLGQNVFLEARTRSFIGKCVSLDKDCFFLKVQMRILRLQDFSSEKAKSSSSRGMSCTRSRHAFLSPLIVSDLAKTFDLSQRSIDRKAFRLSRISFHNFGRTESPVQRQIEEFDSTQQTKSVAVTTKNSHNARVFLRAPRSRHSIANVIMIRTVRLAVIGRSTRVAAA